MFALRARGTMTDDEIVDALNLMGFRTRERLVRDKDDRTKVTRVIGGDPLSLKTMWGMISNPVYVGVNSEEWTQDEPVRCQFRGLVSYELFNAANRGKIMVSEDVQGVHIYRRKPPEYLVHKGVKDSEYPFKRIVMCPGCRKPLYGSASKGKLKYYPVYHCNRGHHFRKPRQEFHDCIEAFVKGLKVSDDYIAALDELIGKALDKQLLDMHQEAATLDLRITQVEGQIQQSVDKIKYLNSATAIKYMEEDIVKLEAELNELTVEREKMAPQEPTDMEKARAYVSYFLAHLEELLLHHSNSVLQAKYFGVIFNTPPTYDEIVLGTPDCRKITGVNKVFVPKICDENFMAGDESRRWNTLIQHLSLIAEKLEEQGCIYDGAKWTITEPWHSSDVP